MGLDLVLGGLILLAAVRGWLRGFVTQAVRIAGLIACVYLAEPVRDYAKPYVSPYLRSIQPDLVDRLLWWVAAVVTYIVLVGFASLLIKMTHRPEIPGIRESGRNDQFAGLLLGAAKGAITAAFLTAGIQAGVQKYAIHQIQAFPWAEEQLKTSLAVKYNEEYKPVTKIWASVPVHRFVAQIQRMGLQNPSSDQPSQSPAGEALPPTPPLQTASRAPKLEVSPQDRATDGDSASSPSSSESQPDSFVESIKKALE